MDRHVTVHGYEGLFPPQQARRSLRVGWHWEALRSTSTNDTAGGMSGPIKTFGHCNDMVR